MYQRTDLEEICSRFYQVRPVVSHIEVRLPKKPPTPNNIGEGLSCPKIQLCKEALFFNTKRTEILAFFQLLSQSNPSLKEKKSSVHLFLRLLRNVTVLMHGNLLQSTLQMVVPILKVFILINHTVQWNMLTHLESTLILHLCIDSLP